MQAHFLDKADAQFKSLQEGMDAAEARAVGAGMRSAGLESALQTSKEQFVRLTADFDNYRKRTVSSLKATHLSLPFMGFDITTLGE